MPFANDKKKATLTFRSITDLANFKNECGCDDFYIERDGFLLVGTFSEEELQLANYKYAATCKIEDGTISTDS
jgi:hypothetical protein